MASINPFTKPKHEHVDKVHSNGRADGGNPGSLTAAMYHDGGFNDNEPEMEYSGCSAMCLAALGFLHQPGWSNEAQAALVRACLNQYIEPTYQEYVQSMRKQGKTRRHGLDFFGTEDVTWHVETIRNARLFTPRGHGLGNGFEM